MRTRILELIDVCRRFGLKIRPSEKDPYGVSIGCERRQFPRHLYDLAVVLREIDSGDVQREVFDHPALIQARMKLALDATFAWMRVKGIDYADAKILSSLVLDAEGARTGKLTPEASRVLKDFLAKRNDVQRTMGEAAIARPPPVRRAGAGV